MGSNLLFQFVTHEGTLYNALGYALAVDALSHSGPGDSSRLDLTSVCADYLAPGLDLGDFLVTENSILIAGIGLLVGGVRVTVEPAIKSKSRLYSMDEQRHSLTTLQAMLHKLPLLLQA